MPMGFKTCPNAYTIELSPSARSRCRRCRQPIAKGAARLRISAFVRPNRATSFFRCVIPQCLADPRLITAIATVYDSVERLPATSCAESSVAEGVRVELAKHWYT